MTTHTQKRRTNVELNPVTYEYLQGIKTWSRIPIKTIVEQMVLWLGEQDQDIQGAIIGSLPMSRRSDFAKMILSEMAEPDPQDIKIVEIGEDGSVVNHHISRKKKPSRTQKKVRK